MEESSRTTKDRRFLIELKDRAMSMFSICEHRK